MQNAISGGKLYFKAGEGRDLAQKLLQAWRHCSFENTGQHQRGAVPLTDKPRALGWAAGLTSTFSTCSCSGTQRNVASGSETSPIFPTMLVPLCGRENAQGPRCGPISRPGLRRSTASAVKSAAHPEALMPCQGSAF